MNTLIVIIELIPYFIRVFKKIKLMVDDGLTNEEIKNALNNIEMVIDNSTNDIDLGNKLDAEWVRSNSENPPKLPADKSTEA